MTYNIEYLKKLYRHSSKTPNSIIACFFQGHSCEIIVPNCVSMGINAHYNSK